MQTWMWGSSGLLGFFGFIRLTIVYKTQVLHFVIAVPKSPYICHAHKNQSNIYAGKNQLTGQVHALFRKDDKE